MFYCIYILHSCSKLESIHLINYPFIMTQVVCALKSIMVVGQWLVAHAAPNHCVEPGLISHQYLNLSFHKQGSWLRESKITELIMYACWALYRCLGGELWHLQHNCVGDAMVCHLASDMFVPLYLHFTVAFKFECSHLINYPLIMTQVACLLKINHCFWIMTCSPCGTKPLCKTRAHDDVIKWKHSPRCWPFCAGNLSVTGKFPVRDQWRGAMMFSLICAWKKQLSTQSSGWWFETPSHPLWRHCNVIYHQYLNFSLHMQSPWLLE